MDAGRQQEILVGVHGSAASAAALRWAAEEARRRDALLYVVRCQEPLAERAPYAPSTEASDAWLAAGQAGLADVLRDVLGPALPATVSAELLPGIPERILVSRSASTDLLVIGSAATSLDGRAMGAVVRACLRGAACPVVVVHPGAALAPARLRQLATS